MQSVGKFAHLAGSCAVCGQFCVAAHEVLCLVPAAAQAVEEAIARMEYELTHESLSADREKQIREKKERAEKNDRPAAMRLAQVRILCYEPCM
jgi:hypothetical protein